MTRINADSQNIPPPDHYTNILAGRRAKATASYNSIDGQLQIFEMIFDVQQAQIAGGFDSLLDQAKAAFGTPIKEGNQMALWLLPATDHLIMAGADEGKWCLMVIRRSLLSVDQIEKLIP